jgi:uncharacterized membrane-anchored protein
MEKILDKKKSKKKTNNWLIFFIVNLTIVLITALISIFLDDIDTIAFVVISGVFILIQTNVVIGIGFFYFYSKE